MLRVFICAFNLWLKLTTKKGKKTRKRKDNDKGEKAEDPCALGPGLGPHSLYLPAGLHPGYFFLFFIFQAA